MRKRTLAVLGLTLALITLVVPSAEAGPPPEYWCSNVCPNAPCSATCWLQGPAWITCTIYDWYYAGGGGCDPTLVSTTSDPELERFLASLESLAEEDAAADVH